MIARAVPYCDITLEGIIEVAMYFGLLTRGGITLNNLMEMKVDVFLESAEQLKKFAMDTKNIQSGGM